MIVLLSPLAHAGEPPANMTAADWSSFGLVLSTQTVAVVESTFEGTREATCVFDCLIQAGVLSETPTNIVKQFLVRPYPPAFTGRHPLKMLVDVALRDRSAEKQAYFMEKTSTNSPWRVTQGWTVSANGEAAKEIPVPIYWSPEADQSSPTNRSPDPGVFCCFSNAPAVLLLEEYQRISRKPLEDLTGSSSKILVTLLMSGPMPRRDSLRLIETALFESGITIVNVGTNSIKAFWTPGTSKPPPGAPLPSGLQTSDEQSERSSARERMEKRRQRLELRRLERLQQSKPDAAVPPTKGTDGERIPPLQEDPKGKPEPSTRLPELTQ